MFYCFSVSDDDDIYKSREPQPPPLPARPGEKGSKFDTRFRFNFTGSQCPTTGVTRKEGNVLFNDALNTFYLRGEREMFYLTTHSTHFIYGYMASDIWLRTILIVRKETCCCHMGYSFWLTARVLLYAPSHKQDSTYHGLCCTSRGSLAGTTGITKAVVCVILSVGWCIKKNLAANRKE